MKNAKDNIRKLKVVWICRVSDPDINDRLKPYIRTSQVAPWISNTAAFLAQCDDLELHVISPHEYISGIKHFCCKGVHFHFFNSNIPFWGRHWPAFFKWDLWTKYAQNKRIVKRIVGSINPDIIHLQGAENPFYSITALQFINKYPVVVNLQRMTLDFYRGKSKNALFSVGVEQEILSKFKHFSIRTQSMESELLSYNPSATTHWVRYYLPEIKPQEVEKEYDIVFFAQISQDKGIEDLIHSLALVKKQIPDIKLCVIGSSSNTFLNSVKTLAADLYVSDNIVWKGFLPSLRDVHLEASKAKISVLPTHYDIIPGTIIESMQLGLPVVSYKAGSIPELNAVQENVLLNEIGDIEGMAKHIINLLNDQKLYQTMSDRGRKCIMDKYSNDDVLTQHLNCYKSVIADFREPKRDK